MPEGPTAPLPPTFSGKPPILTAHGPGRAYRPVPQPGSQTRPPAAFLTPQVPGPGRSPAKNHVPALKSSQLLGGSSLSFLCASAPLRIT